VREQSAAARVETLIDLRRGPEAVGVPGIWVSLGLLRSNGD
jgi:hypothetical protein